MVSYSTVATYLDLLQDSSCVHMVTASFEEGVRWYGAPFQVVGLAGPEAIIVVVVRQHETTQPGPLFFARSQ